MEQRYQRENYVLTFMHDLWDFVKAFFKMIASILKFICLSIYNAFCFIKHPFKKDENPKDNSQKTNNPKKAIQNNPKTTKSTPNKKVERNKKNQYVRTFFKNKKDRQSTAYNTNHITNSSENHINSKDESFNGENSNNNQNSSNYARNYSVGFNNKSLKNNNDNYFTRQIKELSESNNYSDEGQDKDQQSNNNNNYDNDQNEYQDSNYNGSYNNSQDEDQIEFQQPAHNFNSNQNEFQQSNNNRHYHYGQKEPLNKYQQLSYNNYSKYQNDFQPQDKFNDFQTRSIDPPNPNKYGHNYNNYHQSQAVSYKQPQFTPSNDQPHRKLSKDDKIRQQIGRETMQAVQTGKYTYYNKRNKQSEVVDIKDKVDYCVYNTETIKPNQHFNIPKMPYDSPMCRIEVTTESSFEALHRLKSKLKNPIKETCILNFASATQPGGGFLNGRGAQEETLSRQSALYSSLLPQTEMYNYNKMNNNPYYSDYMIYSPNVPFFRDDDYHFIYPFRASVITSPAVNYADLMKRNQSGKNVEKQIREVMKDRCRKILQLCIGKGNRAIVLGAFGCGVFKNPPEMVSKIFEELLYKEGLGRNLTHVVFPIYSKDGSRDGYTYKVFHKTLVDDHRTYNKM